MEKTGNQVILTKYESVHNFPQSEAIANEVTASNPRAVNPKGCGAVTTAATQGIPFGNEPSQIMPIEKHDLLHEFPEHRETIHNLKINDARFARLFDEYHTVDHEVHRIEDQIETPSDEYTSERKAKRLALKDELLGMIRASS